jgi:hypothetical protein
LESCPRAIFHSNLSCRHVARRKTKFLELHNLEAKLDHVVKDLWGLTNAELKACQGALSAFGLAASDASAEADDDSEEE